MCMCTYPILLCTCVLILSERLCFLHRKAAEGLPGGPLCAGPVSLCEWAWIRRLPMRTHSQLSWQSEAHWPVTEIKRRAISVAKTTCRMEGMMESQRGGGEGNGKKHGETCRYSLLLVASVKDAFCPFQPLLSICSDVERRREGGGKRDVDSWTDSFFTHVRQVPSYCLVNKETSAHRRGCLRSLVSLGQLLN